MFGPGNTSSFSLTKIIGGINKTLGVVNQIIPIYKEAKPMINNAKTALGIIKELGSSTTNRVLTNTNKNLQPIKEKINNKNRNSPTQKGPTFFQ